MPEHVCRDRVGAGHRPGSCYEVRTASLFRVVDALNGLPAIAGHVAPQQVAVPRATS
jgi:hypothetical protein